MARTRKTEPDVVVSAAGAAPARRNTAATRSTRRAAAATTDTATATTEPVVASYSPVTASQVTEPYTPTRGEVAELAYSYWIGRGYQGGSPEEDWLRAEQELVQRAR